MKVSLIREKIVWGTSFASKIVNTRSNLPILSNLLLTASEENYLQIESSNLDLSIRLRIPAKVEEPGQVTIPARKFADYLSSLREEKITLTLDKTHLMVEGGTNKTSFVTMPANEFPDLPKKSTSNSFLPIKRDLFRQLVRKTVFATASRNDQIVLTGVYLDFSDPSVVVAAASDSFRMSVVEFPVEHSLTRSVIVPSSALTEVDRLLAEEGGKESGDENNNEVLIQLSENDAQVFFQFKEVEVISRLLEASFPNYKNLIPASFETEIEIDKNLFIEAVKTSSIFSVREGQLVKIKFNSNGQVDLSAQSAEVGTHEGKIIAEVKGAEIELGFNSRYLVDGLSSFDDKKVRVRVVNSTAPVLIESVGEDSKYRHIVMPMDINI